MKKIQILGTGCPKCTKLYELAEEAAKSLGQEYSIDKVTDINEIMQFGVMMTPALVVDGEVKVAGTVPTIEEIAQYLTVSQAPSGGCACCGGCC